MLLAILLNEMKNVFIVKAKMGLVSLLLRLTSNLLLVKQLLPVFISLCQFSVRSKEMTSESTCKEAKANTVEIH